MKQSLHHQRILNKVQYSVDVASHHSCRSEDFPSGGPFILPRGVRALSEMGRFVLHILLRDYGINSWAYLCYLGATCSRR